jgi:deoxyribonucleoside regulator
LIQREKEEKELLLLYEIARLYYEDGLTQEEIAQQTGFSRSRIQRLLGSARKGGIVEIRLVCPVSPFTELEERLMEKFALRKAIVVPAPTQPYYFICRSIGRAAARYLESLLREGDFLGIGWGRTVREVCRRFKKEVAVNILPLIGAVGQVDMDFQVNELGSQLARKIGGFFVPFYAPALVDHEKIAQALFSDQSVRRVEELWDKVNVAVLGMGDPRWEGSMVPKFFLDDPASSAILQRKEVVGDILFHFLCKDGTLADLEFDRRVVSIPLEKLKKIPWVVGVAGSARKAEIVKAALRGGYINVLITDVGLAKALLEECSKA